ncbi:protein kinase C-like [Babylonia areolata]|uniref:protein kinase C-like n=1 Tax=Babylonia areolata TaxID=304850 RepID=UPI003FD156DB
MPDFLPATTNRPSWRKGRNTFDSIQTRVHKKKSSKVRPLPRLHDLSDDSKVRSGSINTSRDPCPEDFFKFHKVLGVGSYGKVHLATFRETGDVVAIKVQLTMHRRRAETEVRVLTIACQSPFLVALHSHFSTMRGHALRLSSKVAVYLHARQGHFRDKPEEHSGTREGCGRPRKRRRLGKLALYLVEDYVPGGKLTEMMNEPFSMPALAFYSGQLVLALDYLHEKGILYRDLKPDNVLLTEKGYLKLCDFGSCSTGVLLNKVKVSTGTPRYWAPEKFLQKPYGLPSDWWSLGIIVYQMLMAKHPFGSAACGFEAYKNSVIKTAPHFKATICPYAVSMCEGLLEKDPEERLGGSAQKHKVFCHPFFLRHISWRALRKQEIRPPPMYRRVVSMPAYRE